MASVATVLLTTRHQPPEKPLFFSAQETGEKARLVLIRGNTGESVSYQLNGTEHLVGRQEGAIVFDDDEFLSPVHANFFYRSGQLFVRDEGSTNGVYFRIRNPIRLKTGAPFLIGEQLLQVESINADLGPQPDTEGTYFYASPKRQSRFRVIQRLKGGETGLVVRAKGETLRLGRENNDINFPDDPFISGRHAEVSVSEDGELRLTDLGSKTAHSSG